MKIREIVSKNLRILRKSKGFTQEQLAEKLNCSHHVISNLESGRSQLSLEVMASFAKIYDIHPAQLLLETDPTSSKRNSMYRSINNSLYLMHDSTLKSVSDIAKVLVSNQD